jgi:hypothetical protein
MLIDTVVLEDFGTLDGAVVETAARAVSQWQHKPIGLN